MRAFVDRDTCTGCDLCPALCPEVFEMDDDFIAVVIADPVPADAEECTIESMESCPSESISIEE